MKSPIWPPCTSIRELISHKNDVHKVYSVTAYLTIFTWPAWWGLLALAASAAAPTLLVLVLISRKKKNPEPLSSLTAPGGPNKDFSLSVKTFAITLSAFVYAFYVHFTCDLTAR